MDSLSELERKLDKLRSLDRERLASARGRHPSQKRLDIVPWCALFVSLLSLTLAVWQGRETWIHDRLSELPALSIERFGGPHGQTLGIQLVNNGVGPAIIGSIEWRINGKNTEKSVAAIRDRLCSTFKACSSAGDQSDAPPAKDIKYSYDSVLPARGQPIKLIEFRGFDRVEKQAIWHFLDSSGLRIQYRSVYKERFSTCLHPHCSVLGN